MVILVMTRRRGGSFVRCTLSLYVSQAHERTWFSQNCLVKLCMAAEMNALALMPILGPAVLLSATFRV